MGCPGPGEIPDYTPQTGWHMGLPAFPPPAGLRHGLLAASPPAQITLAAMLMLRATTVVL
ncbi:MAG: hypothetical protein RJA36_1241 [Pseudomonadota bacterium]|jgi:hypothetical protein